MKILVSGKINKKKLKMKKKQQIMKQLKMKKN